MGGMHDDYVEQVLTAADRWSKKESVASITLSQLLTNIPML